jgi:hypothetical protein
MMHLFDFKTAIESAKDAGLNHIRCSLTGAIIATLDDSAIQKSLEIEAYSNPFMSEDQLIDMMQTRWMIQSSRPAPHLTAHQNKDGFKFLREFYPRDLFAILASRIIFERPDVIRNLGTSAHVVAKLNWLTDLQSNSEFESFGEMFVDSLDKLVLLDAIHNVRHAFYDKKVKDWADRIRAADSFNVTEFFMFLLEVENSGFIALSKSSLAPQFANSMSLSAALAQQGLTPEQIIREEEREMKIIENRRRAIESINAKNAGKAGRAKVNHGTNVLLTLKELTGTLNPTLEAKLAKDLADRQAKKPESQKKEVKSQSSRSIAKAQARFGDIDLAF